MPPKKNKKPAKNGYWQFVMATRDKSTNKNMSMEEIQDYARRKWANMSKDERKPYEELAMLARNTYRPARLTTDGLEIEEVERQEKEAENKKRLMKKDIEKTLTTCDDLLDHNFLIVHINHLIYYPAEDKYFICEIAISAFTLRDGIKEILHRIVYPGKLPLGFYGPALEHSKQTHQLLHVVQEDDTEDNTRNVFRDIIDFMRKYNNDRQLPILYSEEKTFEMITNVFEHFRQDFNFADNIKIYNLQYMFFALRNEVAGHALWPTETFSYSEIEKDVYCYTPKISCDYHEVTDISVYCSQSVVMRYAYTICDNCCPDAGIQLKPGYHVPDKAKVVKPTISSASSMASVNNMNTGSRNSISSQGYDQNYPPLGGSRSSASSMISFSSMKTNQKMNFASASRNMTGMEESIQRVSLSDKRVDRNLKFPAHGNKKQ